MTCRLNIVSLLVWLLLLASAVEAQEVKLKAALGVPITHPTWGVSLARLKEEVEKRSAGAISIQVFDKAQLAYDREIVDAVVTGVADIGATATQNFARKAPAVSVIDLPFLFNFKALMMEAAKPGAEIRTLIDDAILTQAGARALLWQFGGNTVFYSKGGRDVADVARLKDQRVAVPGEDLTGLVEHCGGRPVPITVEKFHDALKDGTVDMAGMVTAPGIRPLRLWSVSDTITYTSASPIEFITIINERTWQSLSPAHQTVMIDAAQLVERENDQRVDKNEVEAVRFAAEKGFKIQDLTQDQVAEWRACSAEMLVDYMERNGDLGRRLMAAYGKLRTDPCCSAMPGEVGFTRH
jgi:C4-dicarboxylate-binding protein DctP